jgi:hypothetical protein
MLPDFPIIKDRLDKLLLLSIEYEVAQFAPFLGSIKNQLIHEGDGSVLIRETGEIENLKMKKSSVNIDITLSEIEGMTLKEIYKKYKDAAVSIAKSKYLQFNETIQETVEKVGNVVNADGKPLSPELWMQMIKKIHLDFDSKGKPLFPTVLIAQDKLNQIKKVIEELEKEPYKKKYSELIDIKHMEYRDRESNRKLVG